MAIAALLHDVVEDCGGKPMLKEVRRRFGGRVAKIVNGCTDSYGIPKPPWRQRKDKLNNIRSILSDYRQIGDAIWDRFNGGREGTLWYYRALLKEFLRDKPNRLIREYELEVRELETIANSTTSEEKVYAAHN
jgi:hypothetical protein